MTTVPGYLVTITAFLPADPVEHRRMADASLLLDRLPAMLSLLWSAELPVVPSFVARHKSALPASAPDPAEPTQPLDNAPAGPAAAGASEEGGDAPSPQQIPSTQSGQDCRTRASNDAPAAGNGGGGCSHQRG